MEQKEGAIVTEKDAGRKQKERRITGYLKKIYDADLDDLLWVVQQYACKASNRIVSNEE